MFRLLMFGLFMFGLFMFGLFLLGLFLWCPFFTVDECCLLIFLLTNLFFKQLITFLKILKRTELKFCLKLLLVATNSSAPIVFSRRTEDKICPGTLRHRP